MIRNFDQIKKQLEELAPAINSFKSESVQLRIVELVFRGDYGRIEAEDDENTHRETRRRIGSTRISRKRRVTESTVKKPRRKGGTSGPVATLNELIDGNFFTKHRTLSEVIEHCRNHKAKTFRPDQLSGPLARTIRNDRLKRQRNARWAVRILEALTYLTVRSAVSRRSFAPAS